MALTLVSWMLAVWLVVICLSVAVPVWKQVGQPSGPSRRSVVAGLLEAAWFAGILRLVVSWSPGSVVLWVVAVVVLAAAVAGAVLRWPELPGRTSKSESVAEKAAEAERPELAEVAAEVPANVAPGVVPVAEVPASGPTVPERQDQPRPVHSAAVLSRKADQARRPSLPARKAPVVPTPGMPRRKSKAGKKSKKEPGNLALAGQAALLVAVVVISFLGG